MTSKNMSGKVQTVLGLIEPDDLGITIMHEHLVLDMGCYFQQPDEASERAWVDVPLTMDRLGGVVRRSHFIRATQRVYEEDAAIDEISQFRYAGGMSLVEVTSKGIARDPLALARISRATGLNIVMGGSYYVPVSHPIDMDKKTEDEIIAEIIRDVTVGVGETRVCTGIIGEIGNFWPLTENLRKVLRASAQAQVETGAPITIHPGLHDWSPHEILDVLESAGANPNQVVMGHLGMAVRDTGALKELAQRGCFLEYDHFGSFEDTSMSYLDYHDFVISDAQEMGILSFLVDEGHLDQIVISHDVCYNHHHVRYGGKGFAHIIDNIVPRMRKRGFTDGQIDTILVVNPQRALTFV